MKTRIAPVLLLFLSAILLPGLNPSAAAPVKSRQQLVPWSAAWVAECSRRYRSFNRKTGYFISTNGRKTFCAGAKKRIRTGNSNPWPPYPRTGKTFKQWQDCVFAANGIHEGYSTSECNDQS